MWARITCAAPVGMLAFRPVTMEPIAELIGYELHAQILRGVSLASSAGYFSCHAVTIRHALCPHMAESQRVEIGVDGADIGTLRGGARRADRSQPSVVLIGELLVA